MFLFGNKLGEAKENMNLDKFIYDESSPTCLRHKFSRYLNGAELVKAGTPAGYLRYNKNGIARNSCVSMGRKQVYLHRVVYMLHYNNIPDGYVIDHIDGNPHNNKISNLRAVLPETNARNVRKLKTNTSGVTGVSLLRYRCGNTYWRAYWHEDGKMRGKLFNCKIYGCEKAKELAIEFRTMQIKRLIENGYNYSERHGT